MGEGRPGWLSLQLSSTGSPSAPRTAAEGQRTDWRRNRNVVCLGRGVDRGAAWEAASLAAALPIFLGRTGCSGLQSPLAPYISVDWVEAEISKSLKA